MAQIIKNVKITWSTAGIDLDLCKGFNVALVENGKDPKDEVVAYGTAGAASPFEFTFRNVVLDNAKQYKGWVQTLYPGDDSDWVSTTGDVVVDDGESTIVNQSGLTINQKESLPPGISFGGYGDLKFEKNKTNATNVNDGEIYSPASIFYHPDGVVRTPSNGTIHTNYEGGSGDTGTFYLMWTDTAPLTRWPSMGNPGNQDNVVPVTYDWTLGKWYARDNSSVPIEFDPVESDCLLAICWRNPDLSDVGISTLKSLVSSNPTVKADKDKLDGVSNGADVTDYTDTRVNNNDATPYSLVAHGAAGIEITGAKVLKKTGASAWDAGVYSKEAYVGGAYVSCAVGRDLSRFMIGLDNNPTENASFSSIDYAFYALETGGIQVYENGSNQGNFGTYVAGDTFSVVYNGVDVRYFHNGVLIKTTAAGPDLKLHMDSSIHYAGDYFYSLQFGAVSSNDWSAVGGAGKPADNADRLNARKENDVTMIVRPVGGQFYQGNSGATGAIKITLPVGYSENMVRFYVDVYDYNTDKSFTLAVGGHNDVSAPTWANTFAHLAGNTGADNTVRFGYDGAKCCIIIGNVDSVWNYPAVTVRDVQVSWGTHDIDTWESGWDVSLITALPTKIDRTITDALLDANAVKDQGALATRSDVSWKTHVTDIPYSTIYNNDDSTALGFNPTLSAWSGTLPDGYGKVGEFTLEKETTIKRVGGYSAKCTITAGTTGYQYLTHLENFSVSPLPEGTFVSGTVDIYVDNYVSGGQPGVKVRLYTNPGMTAYDDCNVSADTLVLDAWQRLPFTARVGAGKTIYAIRIFLMAGAHTESAFGGANFVGTVYFDNLRFALFDSSLDNTAIQIGEDGTLSGGGGGQVTITGLGFNGDLDADKTDYADTRVNNNNATSYTLINEGNPVVITGSKVYRETGPNGPNAGAYSKESYTGGAYASFVVDGTDMSLWAGLNSDPTTDTSYSSIDFALKAEATGNILIYENGSNQGTFGTYVAGDSFSVVYNGVDVRYFHNGTLIKTTAGVGPDLKLHFEVNMYGPGASISSIQFGPVSSNDWSSMGGIGLPADGATVGATWGSDIGGQPADGLLMNSDDATLYGFNPTFDWPSGSWPTGWGDYGVDPVKDTSLKLSGSSSCQWTIASAVNNGMMKTYYFGTPLEAGTTIQGTFDYYLTADNGGGPVGILVDVGWASGYQRTQVTIDDRTTGKWISKRWSAKGAHGQAITYLRIYVMASWSGFAGGNFLGTVNFDNLRWNLLAPDYSNSNQTWGDVYDNDGELPGTYIQSLVADKIAAGTIAAAVSMSALAFNGGSMNIGPNTFTVDSAGNVVAKSISIQKADGTVIMSSGAGMPYANLAGDKPPSNADVTNYDDTRVSNGTLRGEFNGTNHSLTATFSGGGLGNAARVNDGIKALSSTYWELSGGAQYLQADLGAVKFVGESRAYFYNLDNRTYQYAIAVSETGSGDWVWVVGSGNSAGTVSSYETSRASTMGHNPAGIEFPTIDGVGEFGRYVRLYMNGNSVNTGNHGYEWELLSAASGYDPYLGGRFAYAGQITAANASTYIADLAVGTLQIGENQVTLGVASLGGAGTRLHNETYYTAVTHTVVCTGQPILLMAEYEIEMYTTGTSNGGAGGEEHSVSARILHPNGSVLPYSGTRTYAVFYDAGYTVTERLFVFQVIENAGVGTKTFSLQLRNSANGGITNYGRVLNYEIFTLELKR